MIDGASSRLFIALAVLLLSCVVFVAFGIWVAIEPRPWLFVALGLTAIVGLGAWWATLVRP